MERVKRFIENRIKDLENDIGKNKTEVYSLECEKVKNISISDIQKVGFLKGRNEEKEWTITLFDMILEIIKEEEKREQENE